jgi:CheY-like chemotaxis protein
MRYPVTGTPHAGSIANEGSRDGRPTAFRGGEAVVGDQVMRGVILVVDDDEGVRAVMATALEDDGWEVETAENGRSALEVVAADRPAAIILDIRMPVMDGLTFAERYREFPEPRAPLILISATVNETAIRATGAVTGLRKPIDLNVLLTTVRRVAVSSDSERRG